MKEEGRYRIRGGYPIETCSHVEMVRIFSELNEFSVSALLALSEGSVSNEWDVELRYVGEMLKHVVSSYGDCVSMPNHEQLPENGDMEEVGESRSMILLSDAVVPEKYLDVAPEIYWPNKIYTSISANSSNEGVRIIQSKPVSDLGSLFGPKLFSIIRNPGNNIKLWIEMTDWDRSGKNMGQREFGYMADDSGAREAILARTAFAVESVMQSINIS